MRIRIFILAAIITLLAIPAQKTALAAPPYDYDYGATNVYNTFDLTYSFSNLDPDLTYIWYIYMVDPVTGFRTDQLASRVHLPDGVTTTALWVYGASTPDKYPKGYSGPLQVIDHYGNILGRHYVTPSPFAFGAVEPWTNPDWYDTSGNTDRDEKQLIAPENVLAGECQSPLYAAINADGWHHTKTPCTVLTQQGDYALLHYIIDFNLYPAGTDDFITINGITTGSLNIIVFDDIVEYSTGGNGTFSSPGGISFLVLNTAGTTLPFIDQTLSDASFVSGDDPHTLDMDSGVYSCERNETAFAWISDCESVWIVSEDPDGMEWGIEAGAENVGENGTQIVTTTAVTEEVWNAYHGFQEVEDIVSGYNDSTVYSFRTQGIHTYTVASTAQAAVEVTWTQRATLLATNLSTEEEMEFIVSDFYNIEVVRTIEEAAEEVLCNFGMCTDLGRNAALMIVLFFSLMMIAFIPILNKQIYAYLISWTAAGGIFTLAGFATSLGTIMFTIATIALWIFALTIGRELVSADED